MNELNEIEKEIETEFIYEFCNDHNGDVRFLRSIFYDEKDGSEQIIVFIKKAIKSTYLKGIKAGREEAIEELKEKTVEHLPHILHEFQIGYRNLEPLQRKAHKLAYTELFLNKL